MRTARWFIGGFVILGICAAMMMTCLEGQRRRIPNAGKTPSFPDPPASPAEAAR